MKLKTLLLTGLTALSLNALKAQDIKKTSAQDTVTVLKQKTDKDNNLLHLTSLYAGQITGIGFDVKNQEDIDYYSSTRIGGGAERSLTKNNKLKVMGLVDLSPKQGESYSFGQAFIQTAINKNITLNTGLAATSATLLRAIPTTWGGQFEPATDKLIPGGALGARLDIKIDKVDLSAGIATRSGKPEYGMNVGYKGTDGKVNLALWINNQDIYGTALSGSWKSLTILGVINKTEDDFLIGGKLLYSMKMPGKSGSLVFFSTRNGNLQPELEGTSILSGVVALGTVKVGNESLHCMVGPAYNAVTNRIVVYLQIAFQR